MDQQVSNTAVTIDSTNTQKTIRKMQMVIVSIAGRSAKENDHLDHVDVTLMLHGCIDHWLTGNRGNPVYELVDFNYYMGDVFKTAAKQLVDCEEDKRMMNLLSNWFTEILRHYVGVLASTYRHYGMSGRTVTNVRSHDMESERTQLFIVTSDNVVAVEEQDDEEMVLDESGNEVRYVPPIRTSNYL